MNTVTFRCPNRIIANALAILSENGEIQKLINSNLEKMELLESNELEESAMPDFDTNEDYVDHEVELELV